MIRQGWKTDPRGYLVEEVVLAGEGPWEEGVVTERPPDGLFGARWDGSRWLEGSQEAPKRRLAAAKVGKRAEIARELGEDLEGLLGLLDGGTAALLLIGRVYRYARDGEPDELLERLDGLMDELLEAKEEVEGAGSEAEVRRVHVGGAAGQARRRKQRRR